MSDDADATGPTRPDPACPTGDEGGETDHAYDAVVVGAGSGGIEVATGLVAAGLRVAIVADGFVGGECAFVACIPSKSLLRSARARAEAAQAEIHGGADRPLVADARASWTAAIRRRDAAAAQRDDTAEAQEVTGKGVHLVRGRGRLVDARTVTVGGRTLRTNRLVLDTGSVAVVPEIDGLDTVPVWTSDQALTSDELPARLLVLGAGPIGCELSQVYATFGCEVTVVDPGPRPLPGEDPQVGDAVRVVLRDAGVEFRFGVTPTRVAPVDGGLLLSLDDGTTVTADRVLAVTGRRPATDDLGAAAAGVDLEDSGAVRIDDRCRAADGVWAVGDVTGVAPYTHTATHQAAVVVDDVTGGRQGLRVTPDALPRAVYTEPPAAAVGLTEEQAQDRGVDVVVAQVDLADTSRAGTEGEGPLGPDDAAGGLLRLVADRATGLLVGAAAVGPHADSWIGEATVAIRAGVPIATMADVVRPFPTYAQAYTTAFRQLLAETEGSDGC